MQFLETKGGTNMQRRTFLRSSVALMAIAIAAPALFAGQARADAMADAMAVVQKYAQKVAAWDGPTTGPKALDVTMTPAR